MLNAFVKNNGIEQLPYWNYEHLGNLHGEKVREVFIFREKIKTVVTVIFLFLSYDILSESVIKQCIY